MYIFTPTGDGQLHSKSTRRSQKHHRSAGRDSALDASIVLMQIYFLDASIFVLDASIIFLALYLDAIIFFRCWIGCWYFFPGVD